MTYHTPASNEFGWVDRTPPAEKRADPPEIASDESDLRSHDPERPPEPRGADQEQGVGVGSEVVLIALSGVRFGRIR